MDGTQFLWLPWFPEKSGGGGFRLMKNTVAGYYFGIVGMPNSGRGAV